MSLKTDLKNGLKEKCPTARYFQDLYLDSTRGKDAKADCLIVHRTGVYMLYLMNYDCMIYANEKANRWLMKYEDGESEYFKSPIEILQKNISLLNKKCRGMGEHVIPVIICSEDTRIVEMKLESDVPVVGLELFLSTMKLKEYEKEIIPAKQRDLWCKQLQMLEMLSK